MKAMPTRIIAELTGVVCNILVSSEAGVYDLEFSSGRLINLDFNVPDNKAGAGAEVVFGHSS